jgi:hypothetical protein
VSFYENRKTWGALPLGELHDEGICAYCGFRGEYPALQKTIFVSTNAYAHVCADVMACIRRRNRAA